MTSDIRYVVAHRAYCKLVTIDGREITLSLSLGSLERQLPACNILRIHRSYLVNALHVEEIGDQSLLTGNTPLPLSRRCREELFRCVRIIGRG